MTNDGAQWLANHLNGPNGEKKPFGCFWCGGTVISHRSSCPGYDAVHQLDEGSSGEGNPGQTGGN
jgi:hypothetical protein